MIFQLPPTLPPATAPLIEIRAECKKGSRNCFPEDRVGITVETANTTVLNLSSEAIAASLLPEARP